MAEAKGPQPGAPSVEPTAARRESWLFRASGLEFGSIAATVALLIFSMGAWLDWLSIDRMLPAYAMILADAGTAALAGLLIFKVLKDARRRHREMLHHMETIAEMNHHIRNALQVIAYHNVSHPSSDQAVRQVGEAVERIEWALREVLPEKPRPEK